MWSLSTWAQPTETPPGGGLLFLLLPPSFICYEPVPRVRGASRQHVLLHGWALACLCAAHVREAQLHGLHESCVACLGMSGTHCPFVIMCIHMSFYTCAGMSVCLVSPVDGKP